MGSGERDALLPQPPDLGLGDRGVDVVLAPEVVIEGALGDAAEWRCRPSWSAGCRGVRVAGSDRVPGRRTGGAEGWLTAGGSGRHYVGDHHRRAYPVHVGGQLDRADGFEDRPGTLGHGEFGADLA